MNDELKRLLERCAEAIEDLYDTRIEQRDQYIGYQSRWDRYNVAVVETGELLADVRAAVRVDAATGE